MASNIKVFEYQRKSPLLNLMGEYGVDWKDVCTLHILKDINTKNIRDIQICHNNEQAAQLRNV